MPELMEREAAVEAFKLHAITLRAQAESCDPDEEGERRSIQLGGMYEGMYVATRIARALPAIGTCATCRWWGEPEEAGGKTYAECAAFPPHKTACDHYCAAYEPRQEGRP